MATTADFRNGLCIVFKLSLIHIYIFMRVTTEDMLHEPPPQSLPPITGFGNRFHRIIECRIVTVLL